MWSLAHDVSHAELGRGAPVSLQRRDDKEGAYFFETLLEFNFHIFTVDVVVLCRDVELLPWNSLKTHCVADARFVPILTADVSAIFLSAIHTHSQMAALSR